MSLLQALRAQYPQYQDYSDEELTGFLTYQAPSAASPVEAAPADNDAWQITKGFKAGIDQTQALGYGLLGVAGDVAGSEDLRQYGVEGYQRNMQEAQVNAPDVAGFTDIEGVGDALSWAGYTLGNLAPTMATALAGGGIGGLAARKAAQTAATRLMTEEVAKGATRQAAAKTAGEFIAKRIAIGQGLGAYAASTGMETGSIYGDTEDAGVSLVHGAVAGAFDALPIARVLGKFGLNRAAKEQVQKSVTAEVLKQGGLEAGTEALQTLVEQHAKYWVDTNGESLLGNLGEANWKEIADASAAGALGGGVMGGAAGLLTRNPMDDAQDKIRSAGEQAAAAGGDLLDQEIAKAKTAVTEIPEATIEEEQQKQSRAERMTGIDGMIITAERMGFTDEETLLRRAKMLYSQAEAERAKGNQDMASRFIERGNRLYRDATETQEDLRAESVNFPVPYVSQGDVTGGELVPTSVPNFTMPPEDIAGRATEIPTPQTALPGSTTPQLPPGTGQIDMGRDRPERTFTPTGPVTEGIGRNIVERQAQAAPGLPRGNAARTITPEQYRALQQLRRDGLSTKLRQRTPEQVEAIQTVAAVQAGEVNVSASDIEAAAHAAATSPLNALPDPTDAQKAAGNYTKGHFKWAGLDIAIENPQGSKRSGTDDKGRPWENTMGAHYGYVKRTEGNDGDHVDIFIGPNPDSDQVFVIDQRRDKGAAGPFDEHKVMAGFDSQEQAERAYLASYDTGWQLGDVTATTEGDFKQWLKEGDTTKPFADAHTKPGKIDTSPEPVQETAESEQVHLRPNGKPYRTEAGALSSTVYHDNEANAEVVPHGNGFAVRVVARESVTDDQQTASPRTGETQAAETAAGRAKRTVDGQLIYSDGRRWYLQSPENRGSDRVFGDEIYRSEDEATQAARQQAARIDEDRVRRQRLEAEEKADQDAEQAQIDSYQGFLSDAPMKRGHQRATLERIVNHRGKPKTRKQMIEDLLAEGFTLESGQLEKGDSFYNVMTLTKTGLQYAEHLQARESMQEPERQSESPSIQDFIGGKRDDVPSTEEVEAEAKPQPSANTIFTEDAAERARALLKSKLGQLSSGIDPEIMQAGITLAGYHIEKGARTFSAYAKAMVADLGEAVKPYLKSWYMGVKFDPRATGFEGMDDSASVENANIDETVSEQSSLADYLLPRLNQITNNRQLKVAVAEFNSVPVHSVTDAMLKDSQEAMELALVNRAREIVAQGQDDASTFRQLVDLYQKQPNMDVRSSTSMENQAYSTPAPLAFLASRLAGIDGTTTVYEPTAGNGMLLIGADPGKVTANELNDLRAEQLQEQGFKVTQHDATEHTPGTQVDAAIMNPPFGGIAPVKHDGYTIKTIDHLIAAKALAVIKDNGRAVIIIGANKQAGDISPRDRTFFNWLYSHYNVTDHFEVDGYLYKRQGAGWPVRVLVVNGREDSKSISPVSGSIERVNTWDEVYERYTESLDAQRSDRSGAARADATGQSDAEDRSPGAAVSDDQEAGAADQRGTGREPGRGSATGGSAGSRIRRDAAADGRNDDRGGQPVAVDQQGRTEQQPEAAGRAGAVSGTDTGVADRGPSARDRQPRVTQSADGSSFQSSYQTRSGGSNEAVLTPVNMAGATERALRDIEAEVGNIDQYVMDKLGYDSLEDLHKAFMGLQVDTIAAGIYNFERGKGLIIADQTGVGKGRQAAGLLRYAMRQGMTPVFATAKDNLFTDMINELADIGTQDVRPFILNQDGVIKQGDTVLFKNPPRGKHISRMADIIASGELPDDSNMLFLTYSQLNTDNRQRQLVDALKGKALFVLDESHNAAGEQEKIGKGGVKKMTTAGFVSQAINDRPVVYLSATYAKRPDNMPLYYRTDLMDAVDSTAELVEAVAAGGAPLQTVMSGMLAESGQLFRRERSFDGISVKTVIDTDNTDEHTRFADTVTEGLRAITAADRAFHDVFVPEYAAQSQILGGDAFGAGNKADSGVEHTNFTSIVHNFISQLLLGLKAKRAAEMVIDLHRQGQKPVIALQNTMGSFLSNYVEENGLQAGDVIEADYRNVLMRALDRTRRISVNAANGDQAAIDIPLSELDPYTRGLYDQAAMLINDLVIDDLPVSPIDYVRNELERAGVRVSEITGRVYRIDYSSGEPVLAKREAAEVKDRRGTIDAFNGGDLDALVLNAAGSTGLSIHASEKFSDQKPRHMVVMQAMTDINILIQMLGRINRTGQVEVPGYSMMGLNIPAEKRPLARTANKMKSLNANTSANTDSDTSIDAPDIMNKYGDRVVNEYLRENMDIATAVNVLPSQSGGAFSSNVPPPGIAAKLTGRMALLPVQQQREIYEEIETAYANLIDYLSKTNQNDLVPTTADLDARIMDSKVAYEGKAPETLFGGNTVLHKVDAKYQGKPPTPEDVKAALDKAPDPEATVEKIRQDKAADTAYAESLARRLREAERELRDANKVPEDDNRADKVSAAEDKVQAVEARIQDLDSLKEQNERLLQTFKIGHRARLSLGDETVTGVVMAVKDGHKAGKGNPYSLSKVRVQFMVNSGIRQIDLPFSQLDGDIFLERLRGTGTFGLEDIFAADMAGSDRREVRYVATGNLIAGSAKLPKGRIVTFNDKAGQTHQGILMPRNYDDKQFQSVGTDQKFAMRDSKALVKFLRQNRDMIQNLGVANSNNQIRLLPGNAGMWSIQLPKANKDPVVRSVKFDQPLRDAMGTDFYGKTKYMTAQFPESRLAKVVPVLNDLALMQGLPSYRDAWVKSGGNKAAEATKSFSDPLLSPEGFQRRSDIESDRQRAQQLKAQVDKAYLDGDFDRAEDLDAELETLYQDMEDTLAEMQEDGVSALGDDSGADNSMAQRVRDLASKSGVQEDIEGSPTDIIASRYRELYVEQNMLDDEDRAESLRGAFKDAGDFMGGLRDGIADEALLEAAKDLYESREATRKRQKGTKRSIGINPIGMFFKRPYIVEADETPGLSRAQAQQIADDFLAEYNGHIPLDIRVVEDQTEAYGPAGRVGRIGRIKGAYHPASGAAVLVAGNVSSAKDAQTTLRHEILGHYGLNTFTPEDKRAILDAIKASKASLKDTWSDITKRYGDKTEDVQAEEVFAHIAEETRGSAAQLLDRVMALVRKALRRVGLIKSPLSKSELRALVQTIARQIRDGQRQQQNFPQQDSALFRRDSTGFAIPDETLVTAGIRKIADKFKVLKDLQANIRKSGGQIDEAADAYMTEELFHGKAENDLGQMRETFVEPMAKKMAAFGIKQADLDEYLYAKHAPERNRHIASINPEIPDGGSGMTDAEAAAVIAKVRASGNQTQYDQLAKIVYDMLASKRDILVSAGLEDESVVDAWQAAYRNYVPLKGWAEDEQQDALPRTGKGFSVSGKTKRAMGRTSEAASPSSYAIQDLTETLVKRRKNEVGNAFLKLVETNPNKDYWQVFTDDKPETDRKIIKRADGSEEVVERSVPMAMFQDRYFTTKRDGQTFYIKLEDERLMKAMKNIGPETNNFLIRSLATVNRVLSALNTSYNPEFVVGNFSRDVQTAILNLSAEQSRDDGKIKGERIVKQTVKDIPKAMWAAYRGLRGKAPKNAEWAQWFEEFREQGAKTGYYDMKDIDGQAADIERLVTIAKGGFKGGVLKWAQASRQAIEDINSAVENAVRLSAYVNARKAGISQMRAASLAKNMTVNFNRRGEMGTTLNALYMFANASIQGTMNFARTMIGLKGEKGDPLWSRFNTAQKISVAMMGGAVALAMANRMGAGDDDDGENWYDKVPGYVKERNIVIMKSLLGGEQDGSYWKIPLPYGYNIFHVVGTGVEAATNGDTPVTRVAADITLAALGSFSPIGFQDSQSATGMVLKNVAPTIMKPIVDVAMNENFMGSSIYSENFPFGTKKPDSSLARRSTPAGYQAIAEYLNAVSGGSQWRSGAIDINPDVMRYFVDYTLGGAGKFALTKLPDNAYNLAHGVEQSPNQTIFLSRVAGRVLPYEDQSKFYDRRNEIGQVEAEFKALTGRERAEFFREHRGKLALRGLVKATEKHLKALRKRRDAVYQMNLTPAEQDQRLKEIEQRMKAVVDRFNRAYRERR